MHEIEINPKTGIYPATADYLHAREICNVERMLYVSGTMGLDEKGVAPDNLDEQLNLVWSNIRTILSEARMTVENIVRVTSYLRDASFAQQNQDARLEALGNRLVPTTAIVVETLQESWMVELEIVAAA